MMLDKIPTFTSCLEERGGVAQVYVRDWPGLRLPAGVTLPTMLEYGWGLPIPMLDLSCGETGIRATLSFNQTPFDTFVPWEAVVAIAPRGRGVVVCWENYSAGAPFEQVSPRPPAPRSRPAL